VRRDSDLAFSIRPHASPCKIWDELPLVARSVALNYGIPDLAGRTASSLDTVRSWNT